MIALHLSEQYLDEELVGANVVPHTAQAFSAVSLLVRFRSLRLLSAAALLHLFVQYVARGWWGVNVFPHPAHALVLMAAMVHAGFWFAAQAMVSRRLTRKVGTTS